MSTIRQNEKCQVRVPSKLVDSNYGTKVNKTRKKTKNTVLNDKIGGVDGPGKDLKVESVNESENREKSEEVSEEAENRGIKVDETNNDKEKDGLVCPELDTKCNVSETKKFATNSDDISYAKVLNQRLDNKLTLIPTEVVEDGIKVELRYNIFRMWGKFRLKHIMPRGNGVYLFKFKNENGISDVIENGPWMVNVETCKGLPDQIEIVYKNNDNMVTGRKFLKVKYDWKPPLCSFCSHKVDKCGCRPKTMKELEALKEETRKEEEVNRRINMEGIMGNSSVVQEAGNGKNVENGSPSTRNKWNVNQEIVDSIRRSANKFSILIDDHGEERTKEGVNEDHDEEDDVGGVVPSLTNLMDFKIALWNVRGLGKLAKQNDVKNLMNDEKLSIGVIFETRLKGPKVKRIGDKVFGRWSWFDNAHLCIRGCRIMDCVNRLKIDDVVSTGLQYTWTKSLLNPNSSILKKIDRVMGNDEFFYVHRRAHVVFIPYGISDHSHAVLTCSKALKIPSRSFRFANSVADKEEFKSIIKEKWNIEVEGFAMFKLVKKLKSMKPIMNNLNWKNGNLCDKVKKLKKALEH
ncbi:RNA-directed DNA polymerase, eukaryota, reverse transcriptase zinc-binding domain protein [Tanacetum coccineum]